MYLAAMRRHLYRSQQILASKPCGFTSRLLGHGHSHHGGGYHYTTLTPLPQQQQPPLAENAIPHISVPSLDHAIHPPHVAQIAAHLSPVGPGILKLTLDLPDPSSSYLQHLVQSLHTHSGYRLPISHSATVDWFWDVRPTTTPQTLGATARSETMNDFPWHTDCSYEDPPPQFFALQVLQHDRLGGGTLSVLNVARLVSLLSRETRETLGREEYRIATPPEFVKDPRRRFITGALLVNGEGAGEGGWTMRFRRDIVTATSERAARALDELDRAVKSPEVLGHVVDLGPRELPMGSVIVLDNRRWLHCRNEVRDPGRHLRRVRWDAVPFGGGGAGAADGGGI